MPDLKFPMWELNMWWSDKHMPEYLLNNHEAYIGSTSDALFAFLKIMAYVAAGGVFMSLMNYYYS